MLSFHPHADKTCEPNPFVSSRFLFEENMLEEKISFQNDQSHNNILSLETVDYKFPSQGLF